MSKISEAIHTEIGRWKNIKIMLLDIAILAATLILIIGIWRLAQNISYEMNSGYSVSSLADSVEREDYARLIYMCNQDYGDKEEKKEYQEFYALADYCRAASMYKVYSESGDTKRAAYQKEKMNDAEGRLGRLAATKSRVDARFGIAEDVQIQQTFTKTHKNK